MNSTMTSSRRPITISVMRMPSGPPCRPSPTRVKPTSLLRLAALLLALTASAVSAAPVRSTPAEAKRGQLKAIHGRIETLRRDLARSEKTHAQAAGQLKQTESAIADINRALRDLGRQRDGIQAQLTALGKQSQRLEAQIGAQQAQLGRLLYRQYVNGEGEAGPLQR